VNWPFVNAFNDSIARMALREVARTGAHFTWSNRERSPVRCVRQSPCVPRVGYTVPTNDPVSCY
jgi:hypothetical protein